LTYVSFQDTKGSMDEARIVRNIRVVRRAKGITLEELAKLTGLTKGYLSKIERSGKAPPFSTLNRIAMALGVDVTFLLMEEAEDLEEDVKLVLVRKDQRKVVTTKGSLYGYQYEALAHAKPGKNMEPYIITPAFEETAVFQHEGEEFLYVLEGTHEFIYGDQRYIMEEGDCVYFDSEVPHTGRSLGPKRAKLLAVMYSYKRK